MTLGGDLALAGAVAGGVVGVAVLAAAQATSNVPASAVAVKNRNCALKTKPPVSVIKQHGHGEARKRV
jgi:hypothetical protein